MYYKSEIAQELVERIKLVTKANGYSQDIKTVSFDKIRLNIADFQDYELPAVQVIDLSKLFSHVQSRSKSSWVLAIQICMRTTEQIGVVDQKSMWDLQEDLIRAIFQNPNFGLSYVLHAKLIDEATDLHLQPPNYVGTIGLEILYHEPITRQDC